MANTKRQNPNGTCLILLSKIIERGELTGYELKKLVPQVSHQQIYRECKLLLALGYITADYCPQTSKPDKNVFKLSTTDKTIIKRMFNDIIRNMPIHNSVTNQTLDGLYKAVGIASPRIIITWCNGFILHYEKTRKSTEAAGFIMDAASRTTMIDFAKMIKKIAWIKRRKEQQRIDQERRKEQQRIDQERQKEEQRIDQERQLKAWTRNLPSGKFHPAPLND